MKKKNLKNKNGITLIALVVTIVVLLILAGVSISMLTGENGIIKQAVESKENTRGASVEEARDLWKFNIKSDEIYNTNTAQTLNELLNDLINQNLLTEEEKEQIIGNQEKDIIATGQVEIGNRNIDFRELELYPSIRVGYFSKDASVKQIGLVCQMPELSENMKKQEINGLKRLSVKDKETALFDMMNVMCKKYIGKEYTSVKEMLNEIMGSNINSFEDIYNSLSEEEKQEFSEYDDFLYKMMCDTSNGQPMLILEFIVIKPDGSKIIYKEDSNELTMPISEYGIYTIIIKSLSGEYIGTTQIEYKNSKYFMTYDSNYFCSLYDTELKQEVAIDEAYVYYNGNKTDVYSKIGEIEINKIYLFELNNKQTPFELEFIKDGEKIRIPIVITNEGT